MNDPSFKAILFDLDGTLLDSLKDLAFSCNETLVEMDCPSHPIDDYRVFVGNGIQNLAKMILPEEKRTEKNIAFCINSIDEIYSQHWKDHSLLYPEVPKLLDELAKRNIQMSILSNKPDHFTQMVCQHFLSSWDFKIILGAKSEFPKKPDPTSAKWVSDQLAIPPKQWLYLGDTDTDMKTASSAKMYPIGACWGFRPAKELEDNGAKFLAQHPLEILNLF